MSKDIVKGRLIQKARRLQQLEQMLAAVFHIGNPMPPEERLQRSAELIEKARRFVSGLPRSYQISLRREVLGFEEVVERLEEQRKRFQERLE